MQTDIVPHRFMQHSIDTEPDAYLIFHRFNMDIAGSFMDCLFDDLREKLNDRCLLHAAFFAAPRFDCRLCLGLLLTLSCVLFRHSERFRVAVIPVDRRSNITCRGHIPFHLAARDDRNIVHRTDIQRIAHRYFKEIRILLIKLKRDQHILSKNGLFDQSDDLFRDSDRR